MLLKSLVFALIAYGIGAVITILVALSVKLIAVIVQRGEGKAAAESGKK